MTKKIDKSFFSTSELPPDQRVQAWRDSIGPLFDVRPGAAFAANDFNASIQSYLLNDQIIIGYTECSAFRFERDKLRLAQDKLDYFLIQTHVSGSQALYRGSKETRAQTAELMVIDLADRHRAQTSDFSNLTLIIPRHLLAPHLQHPDSQQGRVLKGDATLSKLAVQHLFSLYGLADNMTKDESAQVIEPTLMLLASALNGSADSVEKGARGVALSLLTRTRQEIEKRLHQNLSVDELCRVLGVSRSSLFRLFEPLGGIRNYIQERRLRRCAELLMSPLHARRRIVDIALDFGFHSDAHFSRAFKLAFDVSPSEARRSSLHLASGTISAATLDQVGEHFHEQWLRETLKL